MNSKDLQVLMISLDEGLVNGSTSTGDVLDRHKAYAESVRHLHIIVIGGVSTKSIHASNTLTIYPTGSKGIRGYGRAKKIIKSIFNVCKLHIVVTQDPHATGLLGLYVKKHYSIPLGVHFHGDFWNNPYWKRQSKKHFLYNILQKKTIQKADRIRVVSNLIKEKIVKSGISYDSIDVISTPVNQAAFRSLSGKQKLLLEELRFKYKDRSVVLFVGRLAVEKNLFFMVDVISEIRKKKGDILLLMVGDGTLKQSIQEYIHKKRLDDQIYLIGAKPQNELVVLYRLSILLLLLSTNESFGKVIVEAGVAETPTLASNTSGARQIIDDGRTGFVIPINDLRASVDVLEEMLDFKKQTRALGSNARELYTRTYDPAKAREKVIKFWLKLANKEDTSISQQRNTYEEMG